MVRTFLALLALILSAVPASAQRLSGAAIPDHYSLWFAPDLGQATFRGRETIQVRLNSPARSVALHSAEITFREVTITAAGFVQTARVSTDERAETATFTVPQTIPAGPATIQIDYTGILNDKLRGFYLSSANGRKYAVSQLEATDARRAFPSFDEPVYKATFDVSLMIDNGDTAISNGRQVSDTPGPDAGKHTVTFARTPKISTYLVAMLVGDFVCRNGSAEGTRVSVCSTPDKQELTAFALSAAEQQVTFFNHYFGIKYPFDKLDIIAIPDFAAGAMENAGAITFRERLLLVDERRASLGVRKNVAAIISHEIAHQWVGDLVTMKWWDDIWLNEGFATWAENKPLAAWRPEWSSKLRDAEGTQAALGLDALRSTRAIRTKVETTNEINEVFDPIAYEKTAGVLAMIEGYVGPEAFRKAVSSYLTRYSWSNATGEDFWNEVTRVTGKPVDRIMRSYVDQPGAPVLTVRNACVGTSIEITLAQERFVGSPGSPPSSSQVWALPACLKAKVGEPRCEMIDQRQQTIRAAGCDGPFVNAEGRGYYYSEYLPDALHTLATAGSLIPAERISLLGDEWRMMRAARHDITAYLDLAAAWATDETPEIADAIATRLDYVGDDLVDASDRPRYQAWIRQRFAPILAELGLPGPANDQDQRQSRRASLLRLVGLSGNDQDVQKRARELAVGYIADSASLSGTLAPTVLNVAAVSGDRALYDQYLAKTRTLSAQPEEFYRFFNALASFSDPALVQRTLEYTLTPDVRSQDTGTLIARLIGSPWGSQAAWMFVKSNWTRLIQKLGTFQGIPSIIGSLGSLCSTAEANDVKEFFARNPVPSSERTLRQAVEQVESCAELHSRQSPSLARRLNQSN